MLDYFIQLHPIIRGLRLDVVMPPPEPQSPCGPEQLFRRRNRHRLIPNCFYLHVQTLPSPWPVSISQLLESLDYRPSRHPEMRVQVVSGKQKKLFSESRRVYDERVGRQVRVLKKRKKKKKNSKVRLEHGVCQHPSSRPV